MKLRFSTVIIISLITISLPSLSLNPVAAQENRRGMRVQPSAPTERRIALVIGNSTYKDSPLQNPVNDARDMATALRELGFEVIFGENLSLENMERNIRAFGEKIRNGGIGLFYYAGHGIQVNGSNYLIPVDATINIEAEVKYRSVDTGLVLAQMEDARNRLNIVILDACRNNPFARTFRSTQKGLASIDAPSGTLIAYATAPGSVASDGVGKNGLYTRELLKQMRTPNRNIEQVFKQVRIAVLDKTGGMQIPWEASSLVGDFYFLAPTAPNTAKDALPPTFDPATVELSFWESIKNSVDPEDYKAYLEKYPSGTFVALARNKLRSLEISTKPKATNTDVPASLDTEVNKKDIGNTPVGEPRLVWSRIRAIANRLLKYEEVDEFSEGLALIKGKDGAGYINEAGEEVIPPIYGYSEAFSEGLAVVTQKGSHKKMGYIDKTGKVVIPFKDIIAWSFSEGLAHAGRRGNHGFIDKTGKKVLSGDYNIGRTEFSEGLAPVRINGRMVYIDKMGKEVFSKDASVAFPFSEGLASIANKEGSKWGFIDKTGEIVISIKYDDAGSFSEGLAIVKQDDNYSVIDQKGEVVIQFSYGHSARFSQGLLEVNTWDFKANSNKRGFIDKTGKEVIPLKYDRVWCYAFRDKGILGVVLEGKKGFVDIYGNEYFDFQ